MIFCSLLPAWHNPDLELGNRRGSLLGIGRVVIR